MGIWGILGAAAKIFGGKVHPSLELRVFSHPWRGADLTRRVVAVVQPFVIGENLGKFGGPQLPYQKSQENSTVGRHPLDISIENIPV